MPQVETQRLGVNVPAPVPRDCSVFSALVYVWIKLQFCPQSSAEPQGMFSQPPIHCKVSKRQRNKNNPGNIWKLSDLHACTSAQATFVLPNSAREVPVH